MRRKKKERCREYGRKVLKSQGGEKEAFAVQQPFSFGQRHITYLYFFRFAGYKPGICRQSDNVILTLKLLIGAVPAILILLGLFILLFYPITEESRKETKLALEELR